MLSGGSSKPCDYHTWSKQQSTSIWFVRQKRYFQIPEPDDDGDEDFESDGDDYVMMTINR